MDLNTSCETVLLKEELEVINVFMYIFIFKHLAAGRGRQMKITSWLSPPPWTSS